MGKKSLVCGVGINDVDYSVAKISSSLVNGKVKQKMEWMCPYYKVWAEMLKRCYSKKYHLKKPTYKGCSVDYSWLYLSNFRRWMISQPWEGMQLDKDILYLGNKVYSEGTCVFIHRRVNTFLINSAGSRGKYMLGCHYVKLTRKFRALVQSPFKTKRVHLGYYFKELDAHLAWKAGKNEIAIQLAYSEYVTDDRVRSSLLTRYSPESDWTEA